MNLSFSAVSDFFKCPYYFKLKRIDKIPHEKGSLHTAFGKAVHETIQNYFSNSNLNFENDFKNNFKKFFKELEETVIEKISNDKELKKIATEMLSKGASLCRLAVDKLKNLYPEFKIVCVEQEFIEPIVDFPDDDHDFKGIIDLIIKTPDGKYHILDWKTCGDGWNDYKKNDKIVRTQLAFYKHYFCLQSELELEDVTSHFALIKRTPNDDNIEIYDVEITKEEVNKALKILNNMVYNIDNKKFLKNRLSCKFCEFHKTSWCP
jgi:RecB family exonuclease